MKKLSVLTLFTLCSIAASAQKIEVIDKVLSVTTSRLLLELNNQTVRCLIGDYGSSSLKISVPDLRQITMFRHTTRGETQPCINAGFCRDGSISGDLDPSLVIDPTKPTEEVDVKVRVIETLTIDHNYKTCSRRVSEHVEAQVRGLKFEHLDGGQLGDSTDYEVCLKLKEKL